MHMGWRVVAQIHRNSGVFEAVYGAVHRDDCSEATSLPQTLWVADVQGGAEFEPACADNSCAMNINKEINALYDKCNSMEDLRARIATIMAADGHTEEKWEDEE